ncbi:hypothetical protein E4U42_003539 [Claviceps africana]|uniref:Aminoglycoside phosphotransferase domain-containing protein n=1 Tax=Claviceps africana TaxID=83212 RepID=A0A8K0J6P1_9HYPO|nr:hypothetical protein E4U42_003539 [Claviceps africana]
MLVDEWTKVRSEVATIRYIQRNTTIPIPKIHAYGNGEFLTKDKHTTQSFIIMDEVFGKPLDTDNLCSSATDIQDRFIDEFVGILVQLHELEFPRTGSLYPDDADEEQPIIGPSLYMLENEMQVITGIRREAPPALTTTTDVIKYLRGVWEEFEAIPCFDFIKSYAKRHIFSQVSFANLLPDYCKSSPNLQPLALSHADLRRENILVDDDFRIQGIIDWEWVTILPRQLCVPPLWISGLDPYMVHYKRDDSNKIFEAFQRATSANDRYKEYDKYLKFWKEDPFRLPISIILRSQCHLDTLYYPHIYSALYKKPFDTMAPTFFASEDMQSRLKHREETEKRYVDYLKQEGLYSVTEEDLQKRARLEKMDKWLEEVKTRWERSFGHPMPEWCPVTDCDECRVSMEPWQPPQDNVQE